MNVTASQPVPPHPDAASTPFLSPHVPWLHAFPCAPPGLGDVYSCGWNAEGQLGHGVAPHCCMEPRLVEAITAPVAQARQLPGSCRVPCACVAWPVRWFGPGVCTLPDAHTLHPASLTRSVHSGADLGPFIRRASLSCHSGAVQRCGRRCRTKLA